jgi:hypothetical protein
MGPELKAQGTEKISLTPDPAPSSSPEGERKARGVVREEKILLNPLNP